MKLASIEEITNIKPHPQADRLEIAQVLGWQTVVQKDKFKVGDKIVFIVIDTILPKAPWSEFLADKDRPEKPIRLKTIKLRGEHSQGLVLPLDVLAEHMQSWQIGADVGGSLGVKKYEKEIPAQLAGDVKGVFPSYLCAQTDEENAASNLDLVKEVFAKKDLTVTKKLDGSSCTIVIKDGEIKHVCSRRMDLKETETNSFWAVARAIDLKKISPEEQLIIQGELMGPGIQGNQLKLLKPELYVFQVRVQDKFIPYYQMSSVCDRLGLKVVPLIKFVEIEGSFEEEQQKLQRCADSLTLDSGAPAEGIVVRPSSYIAGGDGRPLGFKIINRNYKD